MKVSSTQTSLFFSSNRKLLSSQWKIFNNRNKNVGVMMTMKMKPIASEHSKGMKGESDDDK